MFIGFPLMTEIKKVNRISGGRLSPESNHVADGGQGIDLLSSLHSCMCRLMIIADSVKRLSSEAANSKAASTASPSMSAAYSNSALFLSEFARMTTLSQNISAAYLSVCTFCSFHCRSWGGYQEDMSGTFHES